MDFLLKSTNDCNLLPDHPIIPKCFIRKNILINSDINKVKSYDETKRGTLKTSVNELNGRSSMVQKNEPFKRHWPS